MGGKIGVESQERMGTEFWFTTHLKIQPDDNSNNLFGQAI